MPGLRLLLLVVLSGIPPASSLADDAPPTDWNDVGPIFAKYCINCHSSHGAALGLRLDSYSAAMAGSVRGAVLLPGNPEGSELVRRIRGESVPRMPFLGYPLPAEDIGLIEQWIAGGLQQRLLE
jgi:Planctomycete cytochrome C